MKTKFKTLEQPIQFIPFEITIKVENIKDATLLWHLANCNALDKVLSESSYYSKENIECSNFISQDKLWNQINNHLIDCGYCL